MAARESLLGPFALSALSVAPAAGPPAALSPRTEAKLHEGWRERVASRPVLFDGPTRTIAMAASTPASLEMTLSASTYARKVVLDEPCLGLCCCTVTADGMLVIGRRNAAINGLLHVVPAGQADEDDLVAVIWRELEEELAIGRDGVRLDVLGLDRSRVHDELVFRAHVPLTAAAVEAAWRTAADAEEHVRLHMVPLAHVRAYAREHGDDIALPGRGALRMLAAAARADLFLMADSTTLWNAPGALARAIAARGRRQCGYIGVSNGDVSDFYDICVGAMERLGVTDVVHVTGENAAQLAASADILVLAGGDTDAGMAAMRARGMDALVRAVYARDGVLVGISAGAVQLGLDGFGMVAHRMEAHVDDLSTLDAGVHNIPFRTCVHVRAAAPEELVTVT